MENLNNAILSAYEDYADALDYVKGWKVEANRRKGVVLGLINVARKAKPELSGLSAKDIFARTAEMYEAAHAPAEDQQTEDQEVTAAEDQQAPAEDQQDPDEDQEEQAPADENPEPNA